MSTNETVSSPDPTRSVTRRRQFVREFRRRWRELRGVIRDKIDRSDRFGLSDEGLLSPEAAALLAQFRRWVSRQLEDILIEPLPIADVQSGLHWTAQFVRAAYEHGLNRADTALRQNGYDVPETAAAAAILLDRHQEQLRAEYVRTYHGVVNAGNAVEKDLTQTFDEQQRANANRRKRANALNERVETVGPNTHTDALAHAVIVVTVNRAALVRYRAAGVEKVGAVVEETIADGGVSVEATGPVTDDPEAIRAGAPADPSRGARWRTARDNKVCPQCRALAGKSWLLSAFATGDAPIPVVDTHPRCRCFLVPITLADHETQYQTESE